MESSTEKKWFVFVGDKHEGPFSLDDIQGKMSTGQISTDNYVWTEGMADWKVMSEIPEFMPLAQPQSTSLPSDVSIITETPEPTADSSALAVPSATEEPTGMLSTLEIRHLEETATTQKPLSEEPLAPQPRNDHQTPRRPKAFLKIGAMILFLTALGLASTRGYFNFDHPSVKGAIEDLTALTQPFLFTLSEQLPFLNKWFSPIPSLPDVNRDEYEALRAATQAKLETSGVRVALAVSNNDPLFPSLYLGSNLPDGAQFVVSVVGKDDTLLNQLSFETHIEATINKKLGKTPSIRNSTGGPIPRGEYTVYVYPAGSQPASIQTLLTNLPSPSSELPPSIPKTSKIVFQKSFFLGGTKDEVYSARLREYHNKLQLKATGEINDIQQFINTLESQRDLTHSKFSTLRTRKITLKQRQQWDAFHGEWIKLQSQLVHLSSSWTPEVMQKEYFFGNLYLLTQQAGQEIGKVHDLQHAYFSGINDPKTYDIQMGTALSAAEGALTILKNKLEQAKNLPLSANGMPRRDGI